MQAITLNNMTQKSIEDLQTLSKNETLAAQVAQNVFSNIRTGFDRMMLTHPNHEYNCYWYVNKSDQNIETLGLKFRMSLGTKEQQFNHNFRKYWKELNSINGTDPKIFAATNHDFLQLVAKSDSLKNALNEMTQNSEWKYSIYVTLWSMAEEDTWRTFPFQINTLDVVFWKNVVFRDDSFIRCLCEGFCFCLPTKQVRPAIINGYPERGSVNVVIRDGDYGRQENRWLSKGDDEHTFQTRITVAGSPELDSWYNESINVDKDQSLYKTQADEMRS